MRVRVAIAALAALGLFLGIAQEQWNAVVAWVFGFIVVLYFTMIEGDEGTK